MRHQLLIVDDEKNTRDGLSQVFSEDFEVFTASSPEEAFRFMTTETFDVIITDLRMGQKSGMSVIDRALTLKNKPACIMMTAYGTIETAVEAMKHGAYDFISKPIQLEKLECIVHRAVADKNDFQEDPIAKNTTYAFPQMLGKSEAFQQVVQQIQRVAITKTTVLVTGETGTGKELVAQQIHQQSPRADKPFVPVHCAALPSNLLESELFGHERGAFTGASKRHIGLLETANHGTLFLDEIGEIDLNIQVKLLRFLETKAIERLGSTQQIPLDVRLVCATNRDLKKEVALGNFREDLYYRLDVVKIQLPSLRERKADIELLLKHYFQLFAKENHIQAPKLSSEVLTILKDYVWPGNIRELRNFAENSVVMQKNEVLQVEDLDPKFLALKTTSVPISKIEKSEREVIQDALETAKGNKSEAARLLEMPRRTFYRKLEKFGLL